MFVVIATPMYIGVVGGSGSLYDAIYLSNAITDSHRHKTHDLTTLLNDIDYLQRIYMIICGHPWAMFIPTRHM